MTGPKDHGILFKPDLILATLAGRKWMTRRAVTVHNSLIDGYGEGIRAHWPHLQWDQAWVDGGPSPAGNPGAYWKVPCTCMGTDAGSRVVHRVYPRVQPGDRLWIREAWRAAHADTARGLGIRYRVDNFKQWVKPPGFIEWAREHLAAKWRSPLHLPKWAARVKFTVRRVGAERAQDIEANDVLGEGVWFIPRAQLPEESAKDYKAHRDRFARRGFARLWNEINGKRPGMTWGDNPRVWIYEWNPLQ